MFFALRSEDAVIADSNPELINVYREAAGHVREVIQCLKRYENTSGTFYAVRGRSSGENHLFEPDLRFSPLRRLLAVMLELERRTGSSKLSRMELALWGRPRIPAVIWTKWLTASSFMPVCAGRGRRA